MCELVTQFSTDQQIQIINTIGTWLAAFATTAAVVVSLRIAMRAERVANKPMLQVHTNANPTDPMYAFIGVEIENVGTGPAFLLPMHFFQGILYIGSNNKGPQIKELRQSLPPIATVMAIHQLSVLRPGERRKVVWIPPERYEFEEFKFSREQFSQINVIFPYASRYGDVSLIAVRDDWGDEVHDLAVKLGIPKKAKLPV